VLENLKKNATDQTTVPVPFTSREGILTIPLLWTLPAKTHVAPKYL